MERQYEKGETILHSGEELRAVGLVLSGSVEIVRDDYKGDRQVMGRTGAGGLFGESYACAPGEPLMVAVEAAEKCRLLFLRVERLLTVCTSACAYHNRLIHNLLYLMAEKNRMLTRKIDHMGKRSIREKVLSYLDFEMERQKSSTIRIPYNRQQLADYLGTDRSALSAELSRMQKDGLFTYEKNEFTIWKKGEKVHGRG